MVLALPDAFQTIPDKLHISVPDQSPFLDILKK